MSHVAAPRFECTDGTSIEADSSVTFEATSFTQLFGNVVFRDAQRELLADRAQYFSRVGRLQAQGSVLLIDLQDGSSLAGEDLVLLQQGGDRAEEDVTVREGRPHARLVPKVARDSSGTEGPPGDAAGETSDAVPYEVDADLIRLLGDRLFQARGRVQVTQESLHFYGDSLEFQQDIGWLTLFDNARLLSEDSESGDTLDVRGDTITMDLPDDRIEEIEAHGRAQLLAEGVDMRGPMIRLAFEEEELERVFAVQRAGTKEVTTPIGGAAPPATAGNPPTAGNPAAAGNLATAAVPAQPRAVAEDFVLTGDSIQADMTEGGLERVVAAGAARGVSTARDSLNTDTTDELIRYDWIEGDTIIATFAPAAAEPADSSAGSSTSGGGGANEARRREMDLLIARVDARSFYRSSPDSAVANTTTGRPALELNYVIGDEIRLYMMGGEVERMEVDNPTGVYLQPRRQVTPVADPTTPDVAAPGGPPGAAPATPDTTPGTPPPADNTPPDGNGGADHE